MFTDFDKQMMRHALSLAALGKNSTSPNPRVGCVITQGQEIVGEGFHLKVGTPHAEVHALNQASELSIGGTAYVTLEPCSHFGRTPPCANALIKAGITKVVAAMKDPNPLVAGQGFKLLEDAGIEVLSGLFEIETRALNRGFLSRIERNRPFVRVKCAASLDGKTALKNGKSQWITSDAARLDVQHMRAESCAVLTGISSIIHDDPRMNVRAFSTFRQPKRIILDTILRTPLKSAIFGDDPSNVWIATCEMRPRLLEPYLAKGIKIIKCGMLNKKVDLYDLMPKLAAEGIGELLVEAGALINGEFLHHNFVDEIVLYQAPKILGDSARGLFKLPETLTELSDASLWQFKDVQIIGEDIRLTLVPR